MIDEDGVQRLIKEITALRQQVEQERALNTQKDQRITQLETSITQLEERNAQLEIYRPHS
jgi:phage shock protein A